MSADLDGQTVAADGSNEPREAELAPGERAEALQAAGDAPQPWALYGARHDVSVKSVDGALQCRCVSVLLGPPSMRQLAWQDAMPRMKPETQLLIALAPRMDDCPDAPKGSRGPSYWGYRTSGNDVVVLLEEWAPRPPQTLAAIIPKPPDGGQVYVAPVSRRYPYGAANDGKAARCALGNPGPKRDTPLTGSEQNSVTASPDAAESAD